MTEPSGAARAEETGAGFTPVRPPVPSLPTGGGAVRGVGEKFAADPATGAGSVSVPLAITPGRSGFGPALSLVYDSGAGNGPFGLGWKLDLPAITRRTDKGVPRYDDAAESDVFVLSGAEDLVPVLTRGDGGWVREAPRARTVGGTGYRVERYRPRVEGPCARIERWTAATGPAEVFWRSISRENVTTWYGRTPAARIADPDDPGRVFGWLISATHDDRGNVAVYDYQAEDDAGIDAGLAYERGRDRRAGRYLKRVRYGNVTPYLPVLTGDAPWPAPPGDGAWCFEVVFDYGDHAEGVPAPAPSRPWPPRPDAFSSYRAGFEVRTHRLCRRVLMFHHFPDDPAVGPGCLVRSTELDHTATGGHDDRVFSKLASITLRGHQRDGTGYRSRALPPVRFGYSEAVVQGTVREPAPGTLPEGIDGRRYQWTDLDGDGLPGVLTRQGGAWFYQRNLGPSAPPGEARFAPPGVVDPLPAAVAAGGVQLLDLAGDGRPDVVRLAGPVPGFHERDGDGWSAFTALRSVPVVDWDDENLRLADLDGDGRADVLVTAQDALTWYPSLGEDGFGAPRRVAAPWSEDDGPAVVLAEADQAIHLADLTGDGLVDLVRVRSGDVCYWPGLGHGRFGAKVTMTGEPLDRPDQFDARRVLLADIDGSGTTDLIYLHTDGVRVHLNRSGNSWADPVALPVFPPADSGSGVRALDLLGTGTACLVWSSPLPSAAGRALRYADLMGGTKPHLLTSVENNLGSRTEIGYAPSTKFCLLDRLAGTPWAVRLPFPVHVVERVTTTDRWRGTTFTSTYSYHHGCFDGVEREVRGFGRVERTDATDFGAFAAANSGSPYVTGDHRLFQPPVKTVTWYPVGPSLRAEYFAGDPDGSALADPGLEEPDVTPDERREALRACRGTPLREEVYELDPASGRAVRLFSVTGHRPHVARLQPRADQRHAVFLVSAGESVTAEYDLDLVTAAVPDPRVAHTLNLTVDEWGTVLQSVTAGYPRRPAPPDADPSLPAGAAALIAAVQGELHVSYVERTRTDELPASDVDSHRPPQPYETRTYELSGIRPADGRRFTAADLLAHRLGEAYQSTGEPVETLPYHEVPDGTRPRKRLVGHVRTAFFDDALSGPLPWGQRTARALPHESRNLVLSTGHLTAVFGDRLTADVTAALGDRATSGYRYEDGEYWRCTGVAGFSPGAEARFFLPDRYTDPFGNVTVFEHDPLGLYPAAATDPAGNRISVTEFDHRCLAPAQLTDANGNGSRVRFDVLGNVAAGAFHGKAGEGDDVTALTDDAVNPDIPALEAFFVTGDYAEPAARALLGAATSRTLYHFGEALVDGEVVWERHPPCAASITRERHAADSVVRASFTYSDGSAVTLVTKDQAEPAAPGGPLRWVASGRTVVDNKGLPVRQYEPYFAAPGTGHRFEDPEQAGVSSVLGHDALGRQVRLDRPDGSHSRVAFTPWRSAAFDPNDTVTEPGNPWYERMSTSADPVDRRTAALTAAHADTPVVSVVDSLGRPVLTLAHNRVDGTDSRYATLRRLDSAGRDLWVQDARGLLVAQHVLPARAGAQALDDPRNLAPHGYTPGHDAAGRLLYSSSAEAGERWMLPDAAGQALFTWTGRGMRSRTTYDVLRRPLALFVTAAGDTAVSGVPRDAGGPPDPEVLVEQRVYGEAVADPAANLRGRVHQVYDGAGVVTNAAHDFRGNLAAVHRRLARDPRTPPDWSALAGITDPAAIAAAAAPLLEPGAPFVTTTEHDALGRAVVVRTPDGSAFRAGFTEAGLIGTVEVEIEGTATPFVTDVRYDAHGRRTRIAYGNGAETTYAYAPDTARLTALRTTRPATVDTTASALFADRAVVQDLRYRYDPVGNILRIEDAATASTVDADGVAGYRYDALYRLIGASGREHTGQTDFAYSPPDTSRRDHPFTGARVHANDLGGLHGYVERYRYDGAGNLLHVTHSAGRDVDSPGATRWRRSQQYALDSNRLLSASLPGDPDGLPDYAATGGYSGVHAYDAHGNTTATTSLPLLRWNHRDQLVATARQVVVAGTPETTYYAYDHTGERVRKTTCDPAGRPVAERLYLGGYELYREFTADGTPVTKRRTLQVRDGDRRIALVDVPAGAAPVIRYQLGNHLGSASVELDESGALVSYEEYHPYGTTAFQAGRGAIEAGAKRYRYTGRERDDETGLEYHHDRYYAPWLGRWISCDPSGIAGGPNVYAYVEGRPVIAGDPTGHIFWFFVIAVVVIATLTLVSEAGAPKDEREAAAVQPHISDEEFAAHTAVTGVSMAVGGGTGSAMKGAPVVLQGMAGGLTGGVVQGVGDQAVQDVKKGEVSSGKQYATVAVQNGATGAVLGGGLAVGGKFVANEVAGLKGEGGPPSNPNDAAAWQKYYEANPNAKRSVGSAGLNDPGTFSADEIAKGKAQDAASGTTGNDTKTGSTPKVTKLPYIPPKGKQVTAQPTGKTPPTDHNAAALGDRGRRIAPAYPRDPLHHVLPQEFREWFSRAPRGIDIDAYAVSIGQGEHSAIHSMEWNQRWGAWIRAHDGASTSEVWDFARQLMREYHLDNLPFTRYQK